MNPKSCNIVAVIDEHTLHLTNNSKVSVVPNKIYSVVLNETNMFARDGGQICDTGGIFINEKVSVVDLSWNRC